ncbi:hypothetical protein ANO11243_070840 [Dothideomycetidae sp. 11243]|nr:hypothetical protein ANO11243_070840 [fungal sp. No.11243]
MPLLGSRRRKTEADTSAGQTNISPDLGNALPNLDGAAGKDTLRRPSLRTKASSPQLRPSSPIDGAPRPGLKRGNSRSWYGSFNSKATAIAQVAKESISVAGGLTSDSSGVNGSQQSASYMHNTLKKARKSIPLVAEATRVIATGSSTDVAENTAAPLHSKGDKAPPIIKADSPLQNRKSEEIPAPEPQPVDIPRDAVAKDSASDDIPPAKQTPSGATWFGWWSRPDGYAPSEAGKSKDGTDSVNKPMNDTNDSPANDKSTTKDTVKDAANASDRPTEAASRAWFGLWSASQNQPSQEQDVPSIKVSDEVQPELKSQGAPPLDASQDTVAKESADASATGDNASGKSITARPSLERPKSSGWAFWSKESWQSLTLRVSKKRKQKTSEKTPPARKEAKREVKKDSAAAKTPNSSAVKDNKQETKTIQTDDAFATSAKTTSTANLPVPEQPKSEESKLSPALKALKAQQVPPNIIEPKFRSTFPQAHVPTYWETIGSYITQSFGLSPAGSQMPPHISIAPQKPKIKNAIAIGVHGYFPAPILQKIIGQPTGTSIRFATHAAAAIRSWVEKNQPDTLCEVESVALEGEGFIADRVSTLWKLLLNWLTHLRNADLILVAAHSQGVPVAIMLVAKLFQLGCLNPNAKVGICAMAGVNLGPFADYKSRFFGGSAAELFEFSNPQSRVSLEYASSVEIVLRHGVKVTYVGSMDDQLVSLESSLFSNLTHPHVQRAVFIDGRLHAPDFIAHLIAFALKLRNLGVSDHGLVRELSAPLAGSIYGGEGHSRVYDDDAVYDQALQYTLETTDMDPKVGTSANPFFLPWAMRGILEEPVVKKDMQDEVKELIRLFDEWKPTSKALKDVKFRLEAVKSKL